MEDDENVTYVLFAPRKLGKRVYARGVVGTPRETNITPEGWKAVHEANITPEEWDRYHEAMHSGEKTEMSDADQYVTPEAQYAAQMDEMSGVTGAQSNMAPYPLYGIPGLGQETETNAVPFWKRPMFCYTVGAAAGIGLGWAFFGWFKPKFMKKNVRRKKKKKAEEK